MWTRRSCRRRFLPLRWLCLASVVAALLGAASPTRAQQLQLQLESEEVYANLPFVLHVVARGFEETPTPTLSKLAIPGCVVTPLGVTPQVSSMVQIVNGQRSEHRNVTFVFRFRIEAARAGAHTVPALTATQGDRKAATQAARFLVKDVADSRDMQLRLVLPDRPLWVGETVDGFLDWYLRRDVGNRSFSVPLFDQDEWLEIEAPPTGPTQAKLPAFRSGNRQLELPFEQQKATLDGVEYSRFRFHFRLTPNKPGVLAPPAPRVVAELQTGYGHDSFGFQVPQSQLFQAVAKPVKVELRALPQSGRPASFKNAVGQAFAIEVQAGRTVVRVGDPIELRVLLRGKGRLAGLILPDVAAMGLSPTLFSAPEEPPSGELLDDGKGKLFRVSVRLRSLDAKEIPALSFSYFDPETGKYDTVQSQPIALSVKGSAVVSAGDVVTQPPSVPAGAAKPATSGTGPSPAADSGLGAALVGADLALSDERLTLQAAPSLRRIAPVAAAAYGLAVLLAVAYALARQRAARWQSDAALDQAVARVRGDLSLAQTAAARDSAPRLCASLRALRAQLQVAAGDGQGLIERLETEAYSPGAAGQPLSSSLRSEVEVLLRRWQGAPRRPVKGPGMAVALLWLPLLATGLALSVTRGAAAADAADGAKKLQQARALYQTALAEADRDRRRGGFAQAEALLRDLSAVHADCPQLLSDWGNAALLAQEPGRAVLAYRRALSLDPTLSRARRNLSFLRDRLPDWLPRPKPGDALASLLFFQQSLAVPHRHLLLSLLGLLVAALLCLPPLLSLRRRRPRASDDASPGREANPGTADPAAETAMFDGVRLLRRVAVLPAVLAVAVLLSILGERESSREAVVVLGGSVLRSADSSGAPPSFAHPLPAGAELRIDEVRPPYARVSLADGQNGWILASTLEALAPERPNL